METMESAGLLHTQEARGSSPCAPTTTRPMSRVAQSAVAFVADQRGVYNEKSHEVEELKITMTLSRSKLNDDDVVRSAEARRPWVPRDLQGQRSSHCDRTHSGER
jgi:hypothetical protein